MMPTSAHADARAGLAKTGHWLQQVLSVSDFLSPSPPGSLRTGLFAESDVNPPSLGANRVGFFFGDTRLPRRARQHSFFEAKPAIQTSALAPLIPRGLRQESATYG